MSYPPSEPIQDHLSKYPEGECGDRYNGRLIIIVNSSVFLRVSALLLVIIMSVHEECLVEKSEVLEVSPPVGHCSCE